MDAFSQEDIDSLDIQTPCKEEEDTSERVVYPQVYRLRKGQEEVWSEMPSTSELKKGCIPFKSVHHVTLKRGRGFISYRVRICKACLGSSAHLELGTYNDHETALLMNDIHELQAGRMDNLYLLCPFDLPFIHLFKGKRIIMREGVEEVIDLGFLISILEERTSHSFSEKRSVRRSRRTRSEDSEEGEEREDGEGSSSPKSADEGNNPPSKKGRKKSGQISLLTSSSSSSYPLISHKPDQKRGRDEFEEIDMRLMEEEEAPLADLSSEDPTSLPHFLKRYVISSKSLRAFHNGFITMDIETKLDKENLRMILDRMGRKEALTTAEDISIAATLISLASSGDFISPQLVKTIIEAMEPLMQKEKELYESIVDLTHLHEGGHPISISQLYRGTTEYMGMMQAMGWLLVSASRLPMTDEDRRPLGTIVETHTSQLVTKTMTLIHSLMHVYFFLRELKPSMPDTPPLNFSDIFMKSTNAISWFSIKSAFLLLRLYDSNKCLIYLDRALNSLSNLRNHAKGKFILGDEDQFMSYFVETAIQCCLARSRLSSSFPITDFTTPGDEEMDEESSSFTTTYFVREKFNIPPKLPVILGLGDVMGSSDWETGLASSISKEENVRGSKEKGIPKHPMIERYVESISEPRNEMIRWAMNRGYMSGEAETLIFETPPSIDELEDALHSKMRRIEDLVYASNSRSVQTPRSVHFDIANDNTERKISQDSTEVHDVVVKVEKNIACLCYVVEHYFISLNYLNLSPSLPHGLELNTLLILIKNGLDMLNEMQYGFGLLWPETSRAVLTLLQMCADMVFISPNFSPFASALAKSGLSLLTPKSEFFAYPKWCYSQGEKIVRRMNLAIEARADKETIESMIGLEDELLVDPLTIESTKDGDEITDVFIASNSMNPEEISATREESTMDYMDITSFPSFHEF